jgi:hypothetical protein
MIATFDTDTSSLQPAVALGTLGLGMGFAMSPATEAIMGALPRSKAGIGSAMNDVVREGRWHARYRRARQHRDLQLRRGHGRSDEPP